MSNACSPLRTSTASHRNLGTDRTRTNGPYSPAPQDRYCDWVTTARSAPLASAVSLASAAADPGRGRCPPGSQQPEQARRPSATPKPCQLARRRREPRPPSHPQAPEPRAPPPGRLCGQRWAGRTMGRSSHPRRIWPAWTQNAAGQLELRHEAERLGRSSEGLQAGVAPIPRRKEFVGAVRARAPCLGMGPAGLLTHLPEGALELGQGRAGRDRLGDDLLRRAPISSRAGFGFHEPPQARANPTQEWVVVIGGSEAPSPPQPVVCFLGSISHACWP